MGIILDTIGNVDAFIRITNVRKFCQTFASRQGRISMVEWHIMCALLVPLDGGPSVDVAKEMTLIGRQEDCDLRLDHKSVSKMHCVLVKTDGLLILRDLGSTNGTRVNGTRVRRAALLPNDKLSVANFHFRVLFGAAPGSRRPGGSNAAHPTRWNCKS